MKKIMLIVLLFTAYNYASAQDVYTSSGKQGYQKKTKKTKGYDPDKLIIGGGLNAGVGGGYADVGLSPMVGYRFTNRFMAGVGLGYEYSQAPDFDFSTYTTTYYDRENIIYPNLWAKFIVWRNWYVTGNFEYDLISARVPYADYSTGSLNIGSEKINVNVPCMLMGVGLRQPLGGRVSVFIEALYDVLQQNYSPYYGQFPILRVGFATGL